MVLDITREEMAQAMLEKVAEHYTAWKQEDVPGNPINSAIENIAYDAVRDAATSMRLVPAVHAIERSANEIAEKSKDGWCVFIMDDNAMDEILKAGLDAIGIEENKQP